jgi:hypothetical protein
VQRTSKECISCTGLVKIPIGKGYLYYVNSNLYPADEQIAPIYEKAIAEITTEILAQENVYITCPDTVQFAVYDSPDGMDEVFLLGCGKYMEKHGYEKRPEIMRKHLSHIMELCRQYGFKPMIWSDMFFRTSAEQKTRHYYDTKTPLPENIQATAPSDLSLIFWDYYHKDSSIIDKLIALH